MPTAESYVPAGSDYYVWWFPGCPLKVHLALEMVRKFNEQFKVAGSDAIREGLLFGKAMEGATEVLDFQPAASGVPEMAATLANDAGNRLLVGYYRIDTGDRLRPKESDLVLARTCFVQPYQVFLIIQPAAFGPPNASFFFRDSDGKMAEFSLMEFPFEPSLLAGEERDRLKRSQEAAARRSAASRPMAASRRRAGSTGRIVLGVGLLLALLLCAKVISANSGSLQAWWSRIRSVRVDPPRSAPALPTFAMGLRAQRLNEDVEITWSRESAVIVGASSGILSIQDGKSRSDITLDISQLRSSSVLYSPQSDSVSIQLSVTISVSTVTESVMLLLPKKTRQKYPLYRP
jgi:hypothetical protein